MGARLGRRLAGCGAGALCIAAASIVPALPARGATPKVTIVADHLDNPRGVSIGTGGRVLVAEAGNGDPNGGRCAGVIDPESGVKSTMCLGFTGAVIAVQGTKVTRVLSNLPSAAAPNGFESTGPAFAVDVTGGKVAVIMQGVTNQPPASWKPWATTTFDHVLLNATPEASLDLGAYEKAHDPAHDGVASDPYSETTSGAGTTGVVVDAGANDALLWKNGTLSTLAVFRPTRADAGRRHDHAAGGADLGGSHCPTARISSVSSPAFRTCRAPRASGESFLATLPTVWKTGFTNIVGLAHDADGSIYVSEITSHGLLQSNPSGGVLFRVSCRTAPRRRSPLPA